MGGSNTLTNLERKVARFKAEREDTLKEIMRIAAGIDVLAELHAKVEGLNQRIAAVELLVRDDHPEWSAEQVKPRRKANRHSLIPYGMLGRTALEVLRDGPPEGFRTREIARQVLEKHDVHQPERDVLDRTANSLDRYLVAHHGDLVENDGERHYKRWRLIRPKSQ